MNGQTPGPWVVRCGPPLFRPGSINVIGRAGDYVCEVGDFEAAYAYEDARLIAAAPVLLDAARLAQSILRRTLADEYHLGDDEQRAEAIAALRAAIAAATGPPA